MKQEGKRSMIWKLEVCGQCGRQLGPGINSPQANGRCPDHHRRGGVIVAIEITPEEAADAAAFSWHDKGPILTPATQRFRRV